MLLLIIVLLFTSVQYLNTRGLRVELQTQSDGLRFECFTRRALRSVPSLEVLPPKMEREMLASLHLMFTLIYHFYVLEVLVIFGCCCYHVNKAI